MKYLIKLQTVLVALFVLTVFNCHAQQSLKVENTMKEIMKKYENVEGVECLSVVKGGGLEMVKMMFNKEFGKDFMKGVTSISFIEYGTASKETRMNIHKELNAFLSLLKEFDISKEKNFAGNDYIRCFAASTGSGTVSDVVIAIENGESKMVMYMAGEIVIE